MRQFIKGLLDQYVPTVSTLLREGRDKLNSLSPPMATPFGFSLIGNSSMAAGTFESQEVQLFLRYLAVSDCCIDVGANIGLYSCLSASSNKHVVAVEPLPANLVSLYKNVANNQFDATVELFPVGLASHPCLQQMYGSGTGASFVSGWAKSSVKRRRFVPMLTLDTIVGRRFDGKQLVIKIDVEGFELEVLKGSRQTMAMEPQPFWLIEICLSEHFPSGINPHFRDIFNMFQEYGYSGITADGTDRRITNDDVSRWYSNRSVDFGSHNYVFLPPGRLPSDINTATGVK